MTDDEALAAALALSMQHEAAVAAPAPQPSTKPEVDAPAIIASTDQEPDPIVHANDQPEGSATQV
jgi:hypothetical protein